MRRTHSRFVSLMALSLMASCSITAAGTATAENPTGTSAATAREPVQYLVKEKSLVGNDIHEAGAKVFYAGLPADNLEPLCDVGRARAAEYIESNKARVTRMISENSGDASQVGDPAKFMEQFAKVLAEERAEHQAQMAKMVELQQAASLQLAQASENMARLAAAIANPPEAIALAETPAAPDAPADTAAADTTAPAKRTRS